MTYGIKNVVGVRAFVGGDREKRPGYFGTKAFIGGDWGTYGNNLWRYTFGANFGHSLDFLAAFGCYLLFYWDGSWRVEAKEWQVGWVSRIVLFNLLCEISVCGFWHWMTYASEGAQALQDIKMNKESPYEPSGGRVKMCSSATGNLEREIFYNTLGWLQSAAWQCILTHLWASGALPYYEDFWAYPAYSLVLLLGVAWWREIHFYWCHRCMHPWWDRENGLAQGDVGAFLYRHVHSLHHKSYNPGPWSGLSMHPVEHLLYYTCATLPPLLLSVHPLHFLYTKFHADIAPVAGHDGIEDPCGNGGYHWLHHAKFECNYGVPFPFNFDKAFGTWLDYAEFKETGQATSSTLSAAALRRMHEPDEEEDPKKRPLLHGEVPEPCFSMEEVSRHNKREDLWVVLYGRVFEVTEFAGKHPGGEKVLLLNGGKDATSQFEPIHRSSGGFALVEKWLPHACVGRVAGWQGPEPPDRRQAEAHYRPALLLAPALLLSAALALYGGP